MHALNPKRRSILYIAKDLTIDEIQKARRRAGGRWEAMMQTWLRRVRGAIGMGVMWGAAWAAVGLVPRWVLGIETDAPLPLVFGTFGFVAGMTFSGVLALTEGRRRFDQMSLPRFAGWGAVGGLLLSAIFAKAASLSGGDVLALAPTLAVASAACATGSLAVARRALRRELPDSGVVGSERPPDADVLADDETAGALVEGERRPGPRV